MFTHSIATTLIATVLSTTLAPLAASAGTITNTGHGANNVIDHRSSNVTDHRRASSAQQGNEARKNTVVRADQSVRDHRTTTQVRDHRVVTPTATEPTVRDHRTPRPNEVVPATRQSYDCDVGATILNRMGYNAVAAYDCNGARYHYMALKGPSLYRAEMNAFTADINVVFIGLAN